MTMESWNTSPVPTRIAFLDRELEGGPRPSEVLGIIGPTGVGKSTLAMHIAVETARQCAYARPDHGVLHFSWGVMLREVQDLAVANAARIRRSELLGCGLSRHNCLKPYEKQLFAKEIAAGLAPPGEFERREALKTWLNKYLLLEMLSMPASGSVGVNPVVALIAAAVHGYVDTRGLQVATVVIDPVDLACRRAVRGDAADPIAELRMLLDSFVLDTRRLIAQPFRCPVWLVYSGNGKTEQLAPTTVHHHRNTLGSPAATGNLDYAFVLGTKDLYSGAVLMNCSIDRRVKRPHNPLILEVGDFGNVMDATDRFVIDHRQRRLLAKDALNRIDIDEASRAALFEDNGSQQRHFAFGQAFDLCAAKEDRKIYLCDSSG